MANLISLASFLASGRPQAKAGFGTWLTRATPPAGYTHAVDVKYHATTVVSAAWRDGAAVIVINDGGWGTSSTLDKIDTYVRAVLHVSGCLQLPSYLRHRYTTPRGTRGRHDERIEFEGVNLTEAGGAVIRANGQQTVLFPQDVRNASDSLYELAA